MFKEIWIGHDRRGNPVYQQTPEGKTTDEILEDFSIVSEAFNAFLAGANPADTFDESFSLEPSDIMTNPSLRIDARFHRPNRHSNWKKNDNSQWSFIKLKEVVKKIYYPGRFKRNYVENSNEAVPFLGGTNISQLILKTDKWLSPIDPKLDDLRVQILIFSILVSIWLTLIEIMELNSYQASITSLTPATILSRSGKT